MKPLRAVTLEGKYDTTARATITDMSDVIRKYWRDCMIVADVDNLAIVIEQFRAIRMIPIPVRWFRHAYAMTPQLGRLDPDDAVIIDEKLAAVIQDRRSIPIVYVCSAGAAVLSSPFSLFRAHQMAPHKPKKPAPTPPRTPRCCACAKAIRSGVWTSSGLYCPRCAIPVKFEVAS